MALLNYWHDWVKEKCVLKNARDKAPSGLFIYTKDVQLSLSANESKHIFEKTEDYESKIIPIDLLDMKFLSNENFCNVSSVTRYRDNGRKWLDIVVSNTDSNVSKEGTIRLVILAYDKEKLS